MSSENHRNGPCSVNFGSIYDFNGCMVEEPTIIVAKGGASPVLLKYGSRSWVEPYFKEMVTKYNEAGLKEMADDIILLKYNVLTGFDDYDKYTNAKFTSDEVCTIINWVNNHISMESFMELLNMEEQQAHERIAELAKLGF